MGGAGRGLPQQWGGALPAPFGLPGLQGMRPAVVPPPPLPQQRPAMLNQPMKRCAMHAYIAHYTQYQQQLAAAQQAFPGLQQAQPQLPGLGQLGPAGGPGQQAFGAGLPPQLAALLGQAQQGQQAQQAAAPAGGIAALAPLLQNAGGAGMLASLASAAGGAGAAPGTLGALLSQLLPQAKQQQQQAQQAQQAQQQQQQALQVGSSLPSKLPPQLAAALQRAGIGGTGTPPPLMAQLAGGRR